MEHKIVINYLTSNLSYVFTVRCRHRVHSCAKITRNAYDLSNIQNLFGKSKLQESKVQGHVNSKFILILNCRHSQRERGNGLFITQVPKVLK